MLLGARAKIDADVIAKAKMEFRIAEDTRANLHKDSEIALLTELLLRSRALLDSERLDNAKLSQLVANNQQDKEEMQRMLDASEGGEIQIED